MATATTRSPPHPACAPQPLHQPRSCACSIPTPAASRIGWQRALAHLQQHGWWRGGPARGPGRGVSSWAAGSAALLDCAGWRAAVAGAPAPTVCSACPGRREQTGQGQSRGERGRDALPPSIPRSPHQAGCIWGGTEVPMHAGSSESCWPCLHCQRLPGRAVGWAPVPRTEGTVGQSQEPVWRFCHTYFIADLTLLKLPASVSRGGHFPAQSWQEKNPNERGQGSSARRAKRKAQGLCLPEMSLFWRTCSRDFSSLNVSQARRRPGEPQGMASRDGAGATSVRGDQGPEVSGREGGRESGTPLHFHCSRQTQACVFCSHHSLSSQSFWLLINVDSALFGSS